MANPFHRPFTMGRGFEHPELITGPEAMRGHPTVPGRRDEFIPRVGRQTVRDGQPGVPRAYPTPLSHGPGVPGPTPSGPLQPEAVYVGEDEQ